jgi:hypothetical protein
MPCAPRIFAPIQSSPWNLSLARTARTRGTVWPDDVLKSMYDVLN